MAEAKPVVIAPRRRGRKKRSMAPASVDALGVRLERGLGERERNWCRQCLGRGDKSIMRYLQISDELAVFVCDAEKCTSLPTLAPGCQIVVQRRAADIVNTHRRKKRSQSLPSITRSTKSQSIPSSPAMDSSFLKDSDKHKSPSQSLLQSHDPPIKPVAQTMTSTLPTTSVIQWPNEGQQCWLDVSMILLAQFDSLRRCNRALGATSILTQLCDGFDEAQRMVTLGNSGVWSRGSQKVETNAGKNITTVGHLNDKLEDDFIHSSLRDSGVGLSDQQGNFFDLLNNGTPVDFFDALVQNTEELEDSGLEAMNSPKSLVPHSSNAYSSSDNSACVDHFQDSSMKSALSIPNLAAAIDLLTKKRKEIFEKLKPSMCCEEGRDDSPVTALPVLLRQGGPIEEHFSIRYRREFYCFACGFTNVTIHRSVVMSVMAASSDFSMQRPIMHHPCPQCRAPGQTSHVKYHSIPACHLVHFSQGLNEADIRKWNQRDFRHQVHFYRLRAIIQYKTNPNHFVIWIRDPTREMWLECDGLSSPLCHWQSQEPSIRPSEVHIMGWEREGGDCSACISLQLHITEIQDAPVQTEDVTADGRAKTIPNGTSVGVSYTKKSTVPAMSRRSASPVMVSDASQKLHRSGNSFAAFRGRSQSLPTRDKIAFENILSTGTPPQFPEFQMPKKNNDKEATYSNPNEMSQIEASKGKQQSIPIGPGSHLKTTPMTVAGIKAKYSSMSATRIFDEIPAQIMSKQNRSTNSVWCDSQPKRGPSFSVLRTLRYLGVNSAIEARQKAESAKIDNPKKRPRPQEVTSQPQATPLLHKIKKVHVPRRKFDSFDAFRQKNSNLFSGYMTQKETPSVTSKNAPKKMFSKKDVSREQEDKYQSSILLTPSSSVSSPSSCSESSLQNENMLDRADAQELIASLDTACTRNEFSNTMDALYKALDIAAQPTPENIGSHQACVLDTDTFLNNLLR